MSKSTDDDMKKIMQDIEASVKKEAKKQLKSEAYEVECPHCGKTVKIKAGKHTCPFCKNEINLTLNFDF